MELGSTWVVLVSILVVVVGIIKGHLKRANWWLYEVKLGEKLYSLPPGDLGWPFIGNMLSFLSPLNSRTYCCWFRLSAYMFIWQGVIQKIFFQLPSQGMVGRTMNSLFGEF